MKITGNEKPFDGGLTIRQQFAMVAMQGILSGIYSSKEIFSQIGIEAEKENIGVENYIAELSIEKADALIKALNETRNPNEN